MLCARLCDSKQIRSNKKSQVVFRLAHVNNFFLLFSMTASLIADSIPSAWMWSNKVDLGISNNLANALREIIEESFSSLI